MKRLSFLLSIVITPLIFFSCTKSGIATTDNPTPLVSNSSWTIAGNTYSGTGMFNDTVLEAGEQNTIRVVFNGTPVAGSYTVINPYTITNGDTTYSVLNNTNCYLGVFLANQGWAYSSDTTTNGVTVTVTGSKITSTFSNIPLIGTKGVAIDSTVSGTVVQQ
jgi:hypothetical protein